MVKAPRMLPLETSLEESSWEALEVLPLGFGVAS